MTSNPEAEPRAPGKLSPRQQHVLKMLLLSHNRKHIADQLGISVNTVSGYVKEVYRHFGVRSHVQLMRQFYEGNGAGRDGKEL